MTLRSAVRLLLLAVLGLPLVQAVLIWVAGLLRAMGDEAAAAVIGHVTTAAGVLWLISLVAMVVTLAVESQSHPPRDE